MSVSFDTLEEALSNGQGMERPFCCPEHGDTVASASVNVLKGVWFCHACQASGRVDGKAKAPSATELMSMLDPEKAPRVYADAYLELFCRHDGYWSTRHPAWVCYALGMGQDPLSGDATFAVHTPSGRLAGVGRRMADPQDKRSRYRYPPNWSSASCIGGTTGRYPATPVVALVEGMADAAAVWATGCPAIAVWGAGLHAPQVEHVTRLNPTAALIGFDMVSAARPRP